MAALSIFGGNITFQNVTMAQGGSSENLLINPRGVINQAGEADGVLAPGQYFCDGWKAGAGGAEVYRDPDGFRLVSGSVVQLVENTLEVGTVLRANLDVLSGAPVMTLGGDAGAHVVADANHIPLEISGNNCKFTRVVVAVGAELPIYVERAMGDELVRCKRFYEELDGWRDTRNTVGTSNAFPFDVTVRFSTEKVSAPAVYAQLNNSSFAQVAFKSATSSGAIYGVKQNSAGASGQSFVYVDYFIADARL